MAEKNKNVLILTVIDVFTRCNISHLVEYSIKYQDVINPFEGIFQHLTIPEKFYVRCDNGSNGRRTALLPNCSKNTSSTKRLSKSLQNLLHPSKIAISNLINANDLNRC